MKSRLIILSDLSGDQKSDWIGNYLNTLKSEFEIKYYDCCTLGEINMDSPTEQSLHSQFVNQGIDIAVKKLLELEPSKLNILAFSIGGTIAWKAGLKGLNISTLFAISSTRLRYETEKPNCKLKLVFGANDSFKPNPEWFNRMKISPEIIKEADHDIYRNENFALKFSEGLKK